MELLQHDGITVTKDVTQVLRIVEFVLMSCLMLYTDARELVHIAVTEQEVAVWRLLFPFLLLLLRFDVCGAVWYGCGI